MTVKAHYDGKVFVPDEPVDMPAGSAVVLNLDRPAPTRSTARDILNAVATNPAITHVWDEIAAGRDSAEVARELRRQASTRTSE
jgi:hypothetical protein